LAHLNTAFPATVNHRLVERWALSVSKYIH